MLNIKWKVWMDSREEHGANLLLYVIGGSRKYIRAKCSIEMILSYLSELYSRNEFEPHFWEWKGNERGLYNIHLISRHLYIIATGDLFSGKFNPRTLDDVAFRHFFQIKNLKSAPSTRPDRYSIARDTANQ